MVEKWFLISNVNIHNEFRNSYKFIIVNMLSLYKLLMFRYVMLTLIGKSWKTHPEIFLKFSFSGSSHRPFYWKTHPLKKCVLVQFSAILRRHTDRCSGKLIQTTCYISYGFSQKCEWTSKIFDRLVSQ